MDDLQFLHKKFQSSENVDKKATKPFIQSNYKPLLEDEIFMGMVIRSPKMKVLVEKMKKIALVDSTVLISGASGSGKELVSRAIHGLSQRKFNNFVSINCGAIPENLLESELFGHCKGSFTGAIRDKKGRFEVADRGSLFLDEIGDMPLNLQVKLLRVMQNKIVEPVGATKGFPINVRIISATHRNLDDLIEKGIFREDLFYRLNVIPIVVPPLSERVEDIAPLIEFFVSRINKNSLEKCISFGRDSMDCLLGYDWPGNIRELENLIERLSILKAGEKIAVSDLPIKIQKFKKRDHLLHNQPNVELPNEGVDLRNYLARIEDKLILDALEKTGGNKNQAAKLLKLNRTTLIEKIKKKKLNINQELNT